MRGPQTSCCAELLGLYVAASLALPNSEIALDNQALIDHAVSPIYCKASDADVPLFGILNTKTIKVRWIPGHRHEKEAKSPEDLQDI